jgi:antitoxin component of MazEF toxin-antitoxin module
MIVNLKPRAVRRIGNASCYVILPAEYLATYGIKPGDDLGMSMDTDAPGELRLVKVPAGKDKKRVVKKIKS